MLKEYRKTATIKAEQFDGSEEMIKKYNLGFWKGQDTGEIYEYSIPTKEGVLDLSVGDWIATGVEDEHWAIDDKIFNKTYEKVKGTNTKEYRKTATIKAEQFDGSEEMMDKYIMGKVKSGINSSHPYVIFSKEGPLGLNIGDYIATGVEGESWAITGEVFNKTYEEVKDTPPRKYRVCISSPDNNSFYEEDYFEVTNESEEEIEQIAKDFAFEHIEWGYEEFKGEVEDE